MSEAQDIDSIPWLREYVDELASEAPQRRGEHPLVQQGLPVEAVIAKEWQRALARSFMITANNFSEAIQKVNVDRTVTYGISNRLAPVLEEAGAGEIDEKGAFTFNRRRYQHFEDQLECIAWIVFAVNGEKTELRLDASNYIWASASDEPLPTKLAMTLLSSFRATPFGGDMKAHLFDWVTDRAKKGPGQWRNWLWEAVIGPQRAAQYAPSSVRIVAPKDGETERWTFRFAVDREVFDWDSVARRVDETLHVGIDAPEYNAIAARVAGEAIVREPPRTIADLTDGDLARAIAKLRSL